MADCSQKMRYYDATIKMVYKLGLESLRTKHIACEAGYSEASMYGLFKCKEDILRETFFEVDRRLSSILLESPLVDRMEELGFLNAAEQIWREVYRYLLEHKEETIFLIRYRYSAYYNEEIRNQRMSYNGSYDKVYDVTDKYLGKTSIYYRGFLVGWMFEVTLCMAERVIMGHMKDTQELQDNLWLMIKAAVTTGVFKKD